MDSDSFVVSDFYELIALQRVFREAKFCEEADDQEISGSPIVARLYTRLIEAMTAADVNHYGEQGRQKMNHWLAMSEGRAEWKASLKRAQKEKDWKIWTAEQKRDYVKTLLTPFVLSGELIERFISIVEHSE